MVQGEWNVPLQQRHKTKLRQREMHKWAEEKENKKKFGGGQGRREAERRWKWNRMEQVRVLN